LPLQLASFGGVIVSVTDGVGDGTHLLAAVLLLMFVFSKKIILLEHWEHCVVEIAVLVHVIAL